jgi:2-oxoglutarate ferredoxin oxidoreductase subunit delta
VIILSKKFEVSIEEKWCKGCGLCVYSCPRGVLELNEISKCAVINPEDCIGCLQCENICPDLAITVKEQ